MVNLFRIAFLLSFVFSSLNLFSQDEEFNKYCALGDYDKVVEKIALLKGDENAINLLLNTPDNNNHTPLYYAVGGINNKNWHSENKGNSKKIVQLLALLGANPNMEHEVTYSSLHAIVMNQDEEMLEIFLRAFFLTLDPNIQDKDGNTPLHLAITDKSAHIIKTLVNLNDINITSENNDNYTILDRAATVSEKHFCEVLNLYIQAGLGLEKNISSQFLGKDSYEIKLEILNPKLRQDHIDIVKKLDRKNLKNSYSETMIEIRAALEYMIKAGDDLSFLNENSFKKHYYIRDVFNIYSYKRQEYSFDKEDYAYYLIYLAITNNNYKAFTKLWDMVMKNFINAYDNVMMFVIEHDHTGLMLNYLLTSYHSQFLLNGGKLNITGLFNHSLAYNNFKSFKLIFKWCDIGCYAVDNKNFPQSIDDKRVSTFLNTLLTIHKEKDVGTLLKGIFLLYGIYGYCDYLREHESLKSLKGNLFIYSNKLMIDYVCLKNVISEEEYFNNTIDGVSSYNFIKLIEAGNFNKAKTLINNLIAKNYSVDSLMANVLSYAVNNYSANMVEFLLSDENVKNIIIKWNNKYGMKIFHQYVFYMMTNFEKYLNEFNAQGEKDFLGFSVKDYILSFIKLNDVVDPKIINIYNNLPDGLYTSNAGIDEELFSKLLISKVKLSKEILNKIKDIDLKYALIKKQFIWFTDNLPEEFHLRNLILWNKELVDNNKEHNFNKQLTLGMVITHNYQYNYKHESDFIFRNIFQCFIETYKDILNNEDTQSCKKLAEQKNDESLLDMIEGMISRKNNLKRKREEEGVEGEEALKKRKLNDDEVDKNL